MRQKYFLPKEIRKFLFCHCRRVKQSLRENCRTCSSGIQNPIIFPLFFKLLFFNFFFASWSLMGNPVERRNGILGDEKNTGDGEINKVINSKLNNWIIKIFSYTKWRHLVRTFATQFKLHSGKPSGVVDLDLSGLSPFSPSPQVFEGTQRTQRKNLSQTNSKKSRPILFPRNKKKRINFKLKCNEQKNPEKNNNKIMNSLFIFFINSRQNETFNFHLSFLLRQSSCGTLSFFSHSPPLFLYSLRLFTPAFPLFFLKKIKTVHVDRGCRVFTP